MSLSDIHSDTAPTPANHTRRRFNATRHGIMGRHTVLPWEDADEYAGLLAAFVDDHRPEGATEHHLVEELAGIVWRKRRLHQAEAGAVRDSLARLLIENCEDLVDADVDFISYERVAYREGDEMDALLRHAESSPAEAARALVEARGELVRLDAGRTTTASGGPARSRDQLERVMCVLAALPTFHERAQQGATADPSFERIARYETHLDRKFERTLAMLVKLRELRASDAASTAAPA